MTEPKKMQVMFAPGVLEEMEQQFDQDELQDIMNELKNAIDSGTLFEQGTAVDLDSLKDEDPELYFILKERLSNVENHLEHAEKRLLH